MAIIPKVRPSAPDSAAVPNTTSAPESHERPRKTESTKERIIREANERAKSAGDKPRIPSPAPHDIEMIPLAQMVPSPENERTKFLTTDSPTTNPFTVGTPDYDRAQSVIDDIVEFSNHLKRHPLQKPITVYREGVQFHIVFGHRRFFALLIAFGPTYSVPAEVRSQKPNHPNVERFIENEQREDLPLYSRLISFGRALAEISDLPVNEQIPLLNKSKSSYHRYRSILANPLAMDAIANGRTQNIQVAARLASTDDPSKIDEILSVGSEPPLVTTPPQKIVTQASDLSANRKPGRARTALSTPKISDLAFAKLIVQTLQEAGITQTEFTTEGVDWEDIDQVQVIWEGVFSKPKER